MAPEHLKPHSDTADMGGSNPNNGHQALSSQPPRWLSSRSRRQSNVTTVPPTTRMTTGRFARWIPSQVTDHLPALPSASSIPYFADGILPNWRRVATSSGNDPELAEPFEVLLCSSSDDSTGTTVHERVDHFSDGNACELRHYRRDEDSFFLVHNAEEISADDKYDPRKWLDRPQTQTQRAARILGDGARAARQMAVRVGETAVVAGEMAMEVARVGAEVARVGAQIGGAIMVANGYDPMFDLVRHARVWSTRSGLEFQDEAQPEIGGFDGDDSEEYESSDDEEDSEDSDKDEIITDGLQLSGQERASNNDSSTDIRFFDAPEQSIASVGHIPIRHANDAFSNVELDSSGSEDKKEDFEDLSIDECRAAFYALEDLGPHTRRRLQASQPIRRGLFTPNIMFGRIAPRRVPPSPSSSSVALVSERPDELPRSKRPGRHH
ncbi:hypothetical protein GTA08_BOTSDO05649 [Botryosphaeria dothidea]|uniref:Uncharacterized protein n=1 Tax=Botryosphaeria dothidea TaxID=55169 RepID=A0A8H4N8B0_9PEZI|nr:hypothetical protein GTA08_BOTSDO05649 [Botryosphaeria dothidea]